MIMNSLTAALAAEHRRDLVRRAADHRFANDASPGRRHPRVSRFTLSARPIRTTDARLLADVDHHDHNAVIAVTRGRHEPVGAAEFNRRSDDPTSAGIKVEVVEKWQDLGVDSMLAARLLGKTGKVAPVAGHGAEGCA